MEHILQIAVSVDDDTIQHKIEDAAVKEIQKQVNEYGRNRYSYDSSKLTEMFKTEIQLFINARSDEIVEKAVKVLARNLARTKKAKAALDDMLAEE